jgi:hypothetical protein
MEDRNGYIHVSALYNDHNLNDQCLIIFCQTSVGAKNQEKRQNIHQHTKQKQ